MLLTDQEVSDIISEISYKDWTIESRVIDEKLSTFRWVFVEGGELQYCRIWTIDKTQPHSDIVRTALAAAIMAEEHEVRERLKYKGRKVFNPHYDVDKLASIAGKLENLEIPVKV